MVLIAFSVDHLDDDAPYLNAGNWTIEGKGKRCSTNNPKLEHTFKEQVVVRFINEHLIDANTDADVHLTAQQLPGL